MSFQIKRAATPARAAAQEYYSADFQPYRNPPGQTRVEKTAKRISMRCLNSSLGSFWEGSSYV